MDKTVSISEDTWLRLKDRGKKGETFDQIIVRLLGLRTFAKTEEKKS